MSHNRDICRQCNPQYLGVVTVPDEWHRWALDTRPEFIKRDRVPHWRTEDVA